MGFISIFHMSLIARQSLSAWITVSSVFLQIPQRGSEMKFLFLLCKFVRNLLQVQSHMNVMFLQFPGLFQISFQCFFFVVGCSSSTIRPYADLTENSTSFGWFHIMLSSTHPLLARYGLAIQLHNIIPLVLRCN